MRPLVRAALAGAALAVLAGAALEVEGWVRGAAARAALTPALAEAVALAPDDALRTRLMGVRARGLDRGHDAATARALWEQAEEHPSAVLWRAASLAATWDGGRERPAARAAQSAARLAPGDARYAAFADDALDAATWADVRGTVRPVASVGAALLALALLVRLGRAAQARRRRAWLQRTEVRVHGSADGRPGAPGEDLVVLPGARSVVLDVFVAAPPVPPRGGRHGPTLSLALSHGRDSRTLRLTPVKDLRQDAVRTRLSASTLAEVLARPGRWRVLVALDGHPVAEAGLRIPGPLARAALA